MAKPKVVCFLACIIFLSQTFSSLSQGKTSGDQLVTAPYPGSIAETYPLPSEVNSRTFYTTDPIEKVKAHYAKSLGAFEEDFVSVVPMVEIIKFLESKGIRVGEANPPFAGVTLYGKPVGGSYSVTKALDRLQHAYAMRYSEDDPANLSKHLEEPELKETLARFEHLKWSHFMRTNVQRKDQSPGNLSMDELLFEKYIVAPEEAVAKEQGELSKKMTELSTTGKYDEATKIGDRMMELSSRPMDARWNWDNAMKCLEEMDKNDYATKIVIDKHPSHWDLSGWK